MTGRASAAIWAGLSACLLAGCADRVPPVPTVGSVALPAGFAYAPPADAAASRDALLPLADPGFVALRERALAEAPTLGVALARIEAARAAARGAGAQRLPAINADASVTGQRINTAQFGGALPPGVAIDTERLSYGANVAASWDLDIFGALRASERAAAARVDAAEADAAAVRLALVAEIAARVTDWRTIAARRATLEQDVADANALAEVTGVRARAGIVPEFDTVRARSLAENSASQLPALAADEARLIGGLATLTGLGAAEVRAALAPAATLAAPAPPPPALPAELLRSRPDIAAAEARLAAADAEVAAAAARRFPRLTLSAALGVLAFALGDLFSEDALVGSVGPTLAGPLLDFGRSAAAVEGARAEGLVAFESYRDAVFSALGEAETAYGVVAAADATVAAVRRQQLLDDDAARLAEVRYRRGLADFLIVLDARRAANAARQRLAAAEGEARRARVLLWQALGGDGGAPGEETPAA